MTPLHSENGPDLLDQAHFAFLRGHLAEAHQILQTLIASEPNNQAAQDLFAQVVAKEAGQAEAAVRATLLPPGSFSPNTYPQGSYPSRSNWYSPIPSLLS